jgi:retron-type reverse transcriptase
MLDRAQQALHRLALEPVAETTADPNSYGFRPDEGMQGCGSPVLQCPPQALSCSRHPKKSKAWIKQRYFHAEGMRN